MGPENRRSLEMVPDRSLVRIPARRTKAPMPFQSAVPIASCPVLPGAVIRVRRSAWRLTHDATNVFHTATRVPACQRESVNRSWHESG